MRIAKAKPFLTKAFLIIYPPFSKRWLKVKQNAHIKYECPENIKKKSRPQTIFFPQATPFPG